VRQKKKQKIKDKIVEIKIKKERWKDIKQIQVKAHKKQGNHAQLSG
jgi:hypothetical protein